MADDGPILIRPIPRRPFTLKLKSPTPPHEDDEQDHDGHDGGLSPDSLHQDWSAVRSAVRFLGAGMSPPDSTPPFSRPQSSMNLTSSTLAGIYSPTTSNQDRDFAYRSELNTPWGTGSQTPVRRRSSIDENTFQLIRDRSHLTRRRSSYNTAETAAALAQQNSAATNTSTAGSLILRGALLSFLGMGCGVLLTRFHNEQRLVPLPERSSIIIQGNSGKYLALWAIGGIALGALMPWFDRAWENAFGPDLDSEETIEDDNASTNKDTASGTDWALVMRAIGAFVGIAFAIRKVAWTSSLQISASLALVNPLMWWLIDRSKPGFILSAAFGLMGSILLLGVNTDMIPNLSGSLIRNNSTTLRRDTPPLELAFGGLVSQDTVESGVWMLSILFCSCLCFGNIGRRLAWDTSTVSKGRWGGLH